MIGKQIMAPALVALLSLGWISVQAQTPESPKYGHMNLGNLLEELPATKSASDQLKVYADSLSAVVDSLDKAFGEEVNSFQKAYGEGSLTMIQAQQKQIELQNRQKEYQALEQTYQSSVSEKRELLLAPILKQIEDAIAQVAKENGLLMVFDISSGTMLFADESIDITTMVKKKLGL